MNKKIMYCAAESLIYSVIIYLVFFAFNNTKYDFLIMNIHPLAVMTGYLALKYGAYIGFIGSGMAIVTYMTAYLSLGNDLFLFFLKFQNYKFFLMFLFINALLGKFKTNYEDREEKLVEEKRELEKKFDRQKESNRELTVLNEKLKNQIISSRESLITLYHMRYGLKNKNLEEFYTEVILMLRQYLKCETISIYKILDSENIKNIIQVGKSSMNTVINLNSRNAGRFRKVIEEGKVMEFPVDLDGEQPVYIFPLKNKNRIYGFINVEKLQFDVKDRYSFELFKIAGEMIDEILPEVLEKTEKGNILSWEYFNQIVEEYERRRNLFKCSYLLFEGKNPGYTPEVFKNLLEKISWKENYTALNEKYIRLLIPMTRTERKDGIRELVRESFKEVEFYEI